MVSRVAMLSLHSSPLDQPGSGSSGGMNVYVRELAQALAAEDLAIDIFTRSADVKRIVEEQRGVRVIALPAGPTGPVAKHALVDLAPALLHGIDSFAQGEGNGYDIVHSHYWISGLVARRLAQRWSVPMVHMFHTLSRVKSHFGGATEDLQRAAGEQRVLDAADVIVVPNSIEASQLRALYDVRGAHLATIPCGIDPAPFGAQSQQSPGCAAVLPAALGGPCPRPVPGCIVPETGQPSPHFVVLALGRIERLKNFALLLQATAIACARDPQFAAQVRVRIAGGPSSDEPEVLLQLKRQASDLGITKQVSFLGPVPHSAVPELYAGADLCVVPSHHESFGLVALEAMAARLPVIATAVGGLQVTVADEITGYLVQPNDAEAMAQRMLTLWSSPCLREAMGMRGARAAQHYAWPVIGERVRCLYESVAQSRKMAWS